MPEPSDFLSRPLDSLNIGSEAADLLRLILSQVGEGILIINAAREVVFINEVAIQLLGTRETPPPDADWSAFYGFFLPDTVTPYPAGQTPLIQAMQGHALAAKLGVATRTLERAFDERVGLPPKTFCRIVRLQRAVAAMRSLRCRLERARP